MWSQWLKLAVVYLSHYIYVAPVVCLVAQVVVRELLGYGADVVCLQECDRKVFQGVLLPVSTLAIQ
jgi:hypothetical protein